MYLQLLQKLFNLELHFVVAEASSDHLELNIQHGVIQEIQEDVLIKYTAWIMNKKEQ